MTERLEQLAARVRRADAEPASPDPAADDLGAIEAVAFSYADGAHVSLYVFETWDAANDAAVELQAGADGADDGIERVTAANGDVLFVGSVPGGDMGATFRINDLVSAFAGRE